MPRRRAAAPTAQPGLGQPLLKGLQTFVILTFQINLKIIRGNYCFALIYFVPSQHENQCCFEASEMPFPRLRDAVFEPKRMIFSIIDTNFRLLET
jgi:hypothetical protein